MKISVECIGCHTLYEFEVSEEGFKEWKEGEYIQVALADNTAEERELLLSGLCDACYPDFDEEFEEGGLQ